MAEIVLIVGGSRSGKSAYAQAVGESLPGDRLFVATSPVTDDEMLRRIEAHRHTRRQRDWHTVEEQIDLEAVLNGYKLYVVVLIDCITSWISNLMHRAEQGGRDVTESELENRCTSLLDAALARGGTALFVTNEVGMGVVPESALGRRFRDLAGRANQVIAARADRVTLVSCGIPLVLKRRAEK